jgi:hypothetical protein
MSNHANTASAALDKGKRLVIRLNNGFLIEGVLDGLANAPVPSLIVEAQSTLGAVETVHIIPLHAISVISFKPDSLLSPTSSDLLLSNLTKI